MDALNSPSTSCSVERLLFELFFLLSHNAYEKRLVKPCDAADLFDKALMDSDLGTDSGSRSSPQILP
jgi:hypothetical protein